MTLEELFNKCIKMGWKPFGWDDKLSSLHKEYEVGKWYIRFHNGMDSELFDLRQLVSKESGLWQFVRENGMTKKHTDLWVRCNEKTSKTYQDSYINQNYGYWLLESALKDESELEEFLLDSIKVDE